MRPTVRDAASELFGPRLPVAERYVEELRTTGIDHGLVGPREADRMWERHVLNCALVAPLFEPDSPIADLGSGAGLPGLVIAIARPDLQVHLVEPLHRRIVWLERTSSELGLDNVTLLEGRAESFAGRLQVRHTTARAVARLAALTAWSASLLDVGGSLLALKGASAPIELSTDWIAMRRAGASQADVHLLGESLVEAGVLGEPTRVVEVTFGAAPRGAGPKSPGAAHEPRRPRGTPPRRTGGGSAPRKARRGSGGLPGSGDGQRG